MKIQELRWMVGQVIANGGMIVAYQWTQLPNGIPVTLTGANTTTPAFTAPAVPKDTIFAFNLRVVDNHGAVSTNPAIYHGEECSYCSFHPRW